MTNTASEMIISAHDHMQALLDTHQKDLLQEASQLESYIENAPNPYTKVELTAFKRSLHKILFLNDQIIGMLKSQSRVGL